MNSSMQIGLGSLFGHALGLRWSDIDVEKATIQVKRTVSYFQTEGGYIYVETEPKTASSRRAIALPSMVLDALKRHRVHQAEVQLRAERWENQELVFCTSHGSYY